jgi:hypothetical protein
VRPGATITLYTYNEYVGEVIIITITIIIRKKERKERKKEKKERKKERRKVTIDSDNHQRRI